MRKHTPRKWLHAILDLLPVLIIPIFAIFTRNENSTFAQEITVEQNQVVDFNQLIEESIVLENVGTRNGVTVTYDNHHLLVASGETSNGTNIGLTNSVLQPNHIFIYRYLYELEGFNLLAYNGYEVSYIASSGTTNNSFRFTLNSLYNNPFYLYLNVGSSGVSVSVETVPQIFDLTQMFGIGNEPTLEQFNQWYPNEYYEYTLSDKQLLKDVSTVTYNNTDIGSQMMYALYNPITKYFNFNKLFNMESVYDWLQLNLFEGNAPIPVHIVWNIIVYEFFMDLIFLLYSFFMFIIDWSTSMIDRFLYKARS